MIDNKSKYLNLKRKTMFKKKKLSLLCPLLQKQLNLNLDKYQHQVDFLQYIDEAKFIKIYFADLPLSILLNFNNI